MNQIMDTIVLTSSRISTNGFIRGAVASCVFLILNFVMFIVYSDDGGMAIRMCCVLSGVWSLLFGAYTFYNLKTRPGPRLPPGKTYASIGINSLRDTFKTRKELPELFTYMLALFIFSDGASTMTAVAALFAAIELNMKFDKVLVGLLICMFGCVISCLVWFQVERRLGVSQKMVLVSNLTVMMLISIYGIVAFTCQWEFFLVCLLFGLNYGSYISYTRSIYATNIPTGHEAQFFSLFEVTDKGTSWAGPLLVGIVFSMTGNFRDAFYVLIAFFAVGIAILLRFNPENAQRECKTFELKERNVGKGDNAGITMEPKGSKVVPES